MGVLTIRNVDDDVIVALKRRAKANHRSLEGELRHLLARHAIRQPTLGVVRERARMADGGGWLGAMSDVGEIVGDIVSPAADPSEWAALRPEAANPDDDQTR
ncbi:FitA-like ribbon-helix-helix domain-containing protein [Candidatus Palauibacter sp.]|uniref:FitA-like ribbon-helix-helix domain-containing protein n=1 Tax=Candidatus Palauibacter sp. TaxID=3101350 RepID=UPI003AF22006